MDDVFLTETRVMIANKRMANVANMKNFSLKERSIVKIAF
jgi:hypothetical protein